MNIFLPLHIRTLTITRSEENIALQQRLKQLAPAMLDGGRAILWYCHLCQKPWYEHGRTASFVCLSTSQLAEIAQQLGAELQQVSALPSSICPLCASLHLGGMPRIEEYPDGQGYRFTWEAITSRKTRLFCIVYRLEHRFYIGICFWKHALLLVMS